MAPDSLGNYYQVGPIGLQLSPDVAWPLESSLQFKVSSLDSSKWQIIRDDLPLTLPNTEILFDSAGSWAAYTGQSTGHYDFVQFSLSENKRTVQARMLVDEKNHLVKVNWKGDIGWTFPFDELFFLNAFSLKKSLLLHSMSLIHNNKAYLFCGVSGAGKSTLGKIFEASGYQVLCDERNAVSMTTAGPHMSSTPFYGTSEQAYKGEAPLAAIVILDPSHSGCDLKAASFTEAVPAIYPMSFLPHYDRKKMEEGMGTLEDIIQNTAIYKLNYNKESSDITAFLEDKLFSQA